MAIIKKPMKGENYVEELLTFPRYASPKIDGIRAHVQEVSLLTYPGKLVRNQYTQNLFGRAEFQGFDGELINGMTCGKGVFQRTSSAVMSVESDAQSETNYYVFDDYSDPSLPYIERLKRLSARVAAIPYGHPAHGKIIVWPQLLVNSLAEAYAAEEDWVAKGFEGMMLRTLGDPYKFGRATIAQSYIVKVKRFSHGEATITGFEELMHNMNDLEYNEVGNAKRSDSKDGLVPSGMIGSYIVSSPDYEKSFKISCGSMDHDERKKRWEERESDLGKLGRYKFFAYGVKDVPRHAIFDGFRDRDDL